MKLYVLFSRDKQQKKIQKILMHINCNGNIWYSRWSRRFCLLSRYSHFLYNTILDLQVELMNYSSIHISGFNLANRIKVAFLVALLTLSSSSCNPTNHNVKKHKQVCLRMETVQPTDSTDLAESCVCTFRKTK